MEKSRSIPYLFNLPVLFFLGVFFAGLWWLFLISFRAESSSGEIQSAFTLKQYFHFFGDRFFLKYLWPSFHVAAFSTLVTLLLGYPAAYIMVRSKPGMRRFLAAAFLIQFFSSYVMRMYAVMLVLGNNGIINRVLSWGSLTDSPVKLMYNEFGVGVGLTLGALPFMVFTISSVMEGIDTNLESAAQSLGATEFRTFLEVTLPLSLPGIAAGIVIVFLYNMSAFVTPALLGAGHFDMISNFIYEQALELMNFPFAGAGAFSMLFLSLILVLFLNQMFEKMIKGVSTK
jgi:ABC-type spermidine/putrescine transport system permease subunit I